MAASREPTPADLRAMLRLSHVVHTSADGVARKQHLLAGLCDLLEASTALSVVAQIDRLCRNQTIVSVNRHGSGELDHEQIVKRCMSALCRPAPRSEAHAGGAAGWRHLRWPLRSTRSARLHHCLWRPSEITGARVAACLCVARTGNSPRPFTSRHRTLLHLTHVEMSWIYNSDLLLAGEAANFLTARQLETLKYLLAGNSEKEIAELMHLSPNTVHHHIKALHRLFGVSTRSELLARWVR